MNEQIPDLVKTLLNAASKEHPDLLEAFAEFQKTGDPSILLKSIETKLNANKKNGSWLN